jgi:arginase
MTERSLALIGVPSSAGAYAPGQERAPEAFRRHGLLEALDRGGRRVRDAGDVGRFRWRPDLASPMAMNLDAVRAAASALADRVAEAMAAGEIAIVLGGDCTVELGTVAGALRDGASVALVYVDLDADLNPPEESDGALDWTGVAHLLDRPGTCDALSALGPRRPMLGPRDVLLLAPGAITPRERETARALSIEQISLDRVKADPATAGEDAARWGARSDRLLVHVDVDVLEYTGFPIAENVRREPGLTLAELAHVLVPLVRAPNFTALTIAEVNPDHAPDEEEAFRALVPALFGGFGVRAAQAPST